MPPDWTAHADPGSGLTYYYNSATGVTQWDPPQLPPAATLPPLRPSAAAPPLSTLEPIGQPAYYGQPAYSMPGFHPAHDYGQPAYPTLGVQPSYHSRYASPSTQLTYDYGQPAYASPGTQPAHNYGQPAYASPSTQPAHDYGQPAYASPSTLPRYALPQALGGAGYYNASGGAAAAAAGPTSSPTVSSASSFAPPAEAAPAAAPPREGNNPPSSLPPPDPNAPRNQDYGAMAREYAHFAPYRDKAGQQACLLCHVAPSTRVFFPCGHKCVCEACLEINRLCDSATAHRVNGKGDGNDAWPFCPLCNEEIKRVAFHTGREEEEYWAWVNEVKPPLPRGFRARFQEGSEKPQQSGKTVLGKGGKAATKSKRKFVCAVS